MNKIDKTGYYPNVQSSEPEELRDIISDNVSKLLVSEQVDKPENQSCVSKNRESKDAKPIYEAIADLLSTALSWIFVPLLMPVYGMLLAFNVSLLCLTPYSTKVAILIVVSLITMVLPMLIILFLKRIGLVHDVGLNERKERLIPYIISILCLIGAGWFIYIKQAPVWLVMFYLGGALAGIINMIVNFRWKISVHAAGVAGVVALLVHIWESGTSTPECFWWLIISIIISGMVGSARIWMGRHTLMQVLCGYVSGFVSVYVLTTVFSGMIPL